MNTGSRIKKLREELNMSQTDLAEIIHSTKQTIYKYENGIVTNIPPDKIEAIAIALKTSPQYLMGWMDENYIDLALKQQKEYVFDYMGSAFSDVEIEHIKVFDKLNQINKNKVVSYTKNLLQIEQLEKEQEHLMLNAAHERTDIEVTDEMKVHDDAFFDE